MITIDDDGIILTGERIITVETDGNIMKYVVFTATSVSEESTVDVSINPEVEWDIDVRIVRCAHDTEGKTFAVRITCPYFFTEVIDEVIREVSVDGVLFTEDMKHKTSVHEKFTVTGCLRLPVSFDIVSAKTLEPIEDDSLTVKLNGVTMDNIASEESDFGWAIAIPFLDEDKEFMLSISCDGYITKTEAYTFNTLNEGEIRLELFKANLLTIATIWEPNRDIDSHLIVSDINGNRVAHLSFDSIKPEEYDPDDPIISGYSGNAYAISSVDGKFLELDFDDTEGGIGEHVSADLASGYKYEFALLDWSGHQRGSSEEGLASKNTKVEITLEGKPFRIQTASEDKLLWRILEVKEISGKWTGMFRNSYTDDFATYLCDDIYSSGRCPNNDDNDDYDRFNIRAKH